MHKYTEKMFALQTLCEIVVVRCNLDVRTNTRASMSLTFQAMSVAERRSSRDIQIVAASHHTTAEVVNGDDACITLARCNQCTALEVAMWNRFRGTVRPRGMLHIGRRTDDDDDDDNDNDNDVACLPMTLIRECVNVGCIRCIEMCIKVFSLTRNIVCEL